MLTINFIKENKELVLERLSVKNFKNPELVDKVLELDVQRRQTQLKLDNLLAESNKRSKGFSGNKGIIKLNEEQPKYVPVITLSKEEIRSTSEELKKLEKEIQDILVLIPNLPYASVPRGRSAVDNVEVRKGGTKPMLPKGAMPHWDLAKKYDIIDFELGVKLTGAGFPVYKGKGARLQRALINFFLDEARNAGYVEIMPPLMVNEASGFGTGQLPDKEGQMYYVTDDKFYLIPTAEVPVTNIYRDVILNANDFPIKNTAYTPCFRREAGSYGKDVRGLNRLHQFDKVEIVQIQHPDKSYEVLEEMVKYIESLVQKLELPYRIIKLCGGDMSFASALTYDFEVYAAAQDKWLEVSSVSNFESFQANRMKLRFKDINDKKTKLAHTLNGSALALPRIVAALLENNQSDGGIFIPRALIPYTVFEVID